MLKLKIPYSCTLSERFFIEKTNELLYNETVDSYRLRIHNPFTILHELRQVIDDLHHKKLKNESYAISLINEAHFLISLENELKFKSLSKKYFLNLLNHTKDKGKDLKQIFYSTNLIIKDNEDYIKTIFAKISEEINRLNGLSAPIVTDLKVLNGIIGFFFVQLIHLGFSKQYLYTFFRSIFFSPTHGTFQERLDILGELMIRRLERFSIIIGLSMPSEQWSKIEILNTEFKRVNKSERRRLVQETNQKAEDFFNKYKEKALFYLIEIDSWDYFSAVKLARHKVQTFFDSLHMGHSNINMKIIDECLVVGTVYPKRAGVQKLAYHFDGYYKSEQELYKEFLKKMEAIDQKGISKIAKSKINAGLRYLRLGFEATEIETKLLNYWIGLEYIFAPSESDDHTIGRILGFFKKCHAVIYLKRNLKYLHDCIATFELNSSIPGYNEDLKYLATGTNYGIVLSHLEEYPLLAYRANSFKEQLEDIKKTKGTLEKHQNNLEWNLNRIYRLRNEIVHNAAIHKNLESITSHVRYYLVFILNGLIDFFINTAGHVNNEHKLNIDDYFIMQEILIKNICDDQNYLSFEYLLSLHNPVEYLT